MDKKIIAYKGFDENFACRGFQYEVGKTYKHDGAVELCHSGFHACTDPFDVWNYYGPTLRFAEVEAAEPVTDGGDDSKIATAEITIKAELSLPVFVARVVNRLIDATKGKGKKADEDSAKIGSSGDSAQIGSSGDYAQIGSSGYYAQIGSSGDYAKIGSSGDSAKIGSSGDSAKIGSSGDSAQIGSSGDSAKIGSSGDSAKIGSSGDSAQIGSSGDYAQIGSSGYYAKIGSSGYSAKIDVSGKKSVVASAGHRTRVKAKAGTWVSLAEFNDDGECIGFASGCVGKTKVRGKVIPADVWLLAKDGKLVPEAAS